mgnify:FL=1
MCGIVGYISVSKKGIQAFESRLFEELIIASSVRGRDATGIFKVDKRGNVFSIKGQGNPFALFQASNYNSFHISQKKEVIKTLVGHNRFATSGDKSVKNAHPFLHGNIMLVHNGTVEEHSPLLRKDSPETDSDALCKSIDQIGLEKTLRIAWGPMAIVFFNKKESTLNFYRNNGRPLYVCSITKNMDYVFASEKPMLEWILDRNFNFKSQKEVSEIPAYTLVSINLNSGQRKQQPIDVVFSAGSSPPINKSFVVSSSNLIPSNSLIKEDGSSRYYSAQTLLNYQVESEIVFCLTTTQSISDDPEDERWLLTGERDDLPGVEMRYICRSRENKDALEEHMVVTGKIKHIRYDTQTKEKKEHKMYVTECVPCTMPGQTRDIVGRSILKDLFTFCIKPNKHLNS